MINALSITLSSTLVLFCVLLIGYIVGKANILPENSAAVLSKAETFVFVPAVVLNTLMTNCTVNSFHMQIQYMGYAAVALAIAFLLGIPLAGLLQKNGYTKSVYKYALVFSNFGFVGMSLVPMILGQEALSGFSMYIFPINTAVYTYGVAILITNGKKKKWWKCLVNPMSICMITGIFLGITGAGRKLPVFLNTMLSGLSGCMSPVAMLLTGITISQFSPKRIFTDLKTYIVSVLRLIILPLIILFVMHFLRVGREVLLYTLFTYAAPIGLNVIVFPASCGEDTSSGAALATVSHLLCVLTIPLMYVLLTFLGWI